MIGAVQFDLIGEIFYDIFKLIFCKPKPHDLHTETPKDKRQDDSKRVPYHV